MAIGAEMSLESLSSPPRSGQTVLANLEVNDRCAFSVSCGSTCYLNQVHIDRPPLSESLVLAAAKAMIQCGDVIRHLAVVGKEAFESPELLLEIARAYNSVPEAQRPASLGVISASPSGIKRWLPQFAETPLSWLAVSVDVPNSGLRSGDPLRVLDAALTGRTSGGTRAVAVNTTFTEQTMAEVLALSRYWQGEQLDQWALCPLVMASGSSMRSSVSVEAVHRMIDKCATILDAAGRVVIETDPLTLRSLLGERTWRTVNTHVWRIEIQLPNGLWLFARSPDLGYFIRQRFDGSLLSRQDFGKVGLTEGRYGRFRTDADIARALEIMESERYASLCACATDTRPQALAA